MNDHARKMTLAACGALLAAVVAIPFADSAVDRKQLEELEMHVTDFKDLQPNEAAPRDTLPGAQFMAPGAVVFIDNDEFNLTNSNRSWGFTGRDRARIIFETPATSVSLIGRGSAKTDTMGPLFGKAPLSPANGMVVFRDAAGHVIATKMLENLSVRSDDAQLIRFKAETGIGSVELINRARGRKSLVVIAGIGFTPKRDGSNLPKDNQSCPGDISGPQISDQPDGAVDIADVLAVLRQFGPCLSDQADGSCPGDISGPFDTPDDVVDISDLVAVLSRVGNCP